MSKHQSSPLEIVDRQLRAYNARDIESYCALFSPDAVISRLDDGREIVRGSEAIRRYYVERFKNSRLHCRIKNRLELGNFVIDYEQVEGVVEGILEVIAIYNVRHGLIQTVQFVWPELPK